MFIGNVEYFPEKDILMLFAEQPENDPYKYFLDGLSINDLKWNMPFKSVYCFHSKKDFLEVFRNKANFRNGDRPDSMWYWVFYEGRCICSGACDPGDIEGFAESFNLSDEELEEYYEVLNKEEDQENAAIAKKGEAVDNNIYILFTCDEWKSRDSMRLVCATTDLEKLKNAISESIKVDSMVYTHGEMSDAACDTTEFVQDWDELVVPATKVTMTEKARSCAVDKALSDINSTLSFGFIETVEDGEIV